MNTENDSNVQIKEQTSFLEKGPLPVVKKADDELKSSDFENSGIKDDVFSKENADLVRILESIAVFVCWTIDDRKKAIKCTSIKTLQN